MYRKWLMAVLGLCVAMAVLYTGFWFFLSHKASQKLNHFNEQLPYQPLRSALVGFHCLGILTSKSQPKKESKMSLITFMI